MLNSSSSYLYGLCHGGTYYINNFEYNKPGYAGIYDNHCNFQPSWEHASDSALYGCQNLAGSTLLHLCIHSLFSCEQGNDNYNRPGYSGISQTMLNIPPTYADSVCSALYGCFLISNSNTLYMAPYGGYYETSTGLAHNLPGFHGLCDISVDHTPNYQSGVVSAFKLIN